MTHDSGFLNNKARWNSFEWNRWGIDETALGFEIESVVELHGKEGARFNEKSLSITIDSEGPELHPREYMILNEDALGFEMEMEFVYEILYSKFLDLLPLVPEKFRTSVPLQDYLRSVGIYAGTWLSQIDEIRFLLNPATVEQDYIQYLADTIGLELVKSDPPLDELRRQLAQAIDWYKIKGCYESIQYVLHVLNMTVNIYDMYTNNYTSFVRQPWFVGEEGENPPGLDPSYYKSPHFGLEVLLNVVYNAGSDEFLWSREKFVDVLTSVEKVRPVNTVPHYSLLLNPVTDETRRVVVVDGNIRTAVLDAWEDLFLHFDMDYAHPGSGLVAVYNQCPTYNICNYNQFGTGSGGWNFDDGKVFDYFNQTFFDSITKWKLGIGNKGSSPDESGFLIDSPVLSGSITNKRRTSDGVEFEFVIPTGVYQQGLSELGIYLDDDTTLVLASCFPDIEKLSEQELRVLVQVMKR